MGDFLIEKVERLADQCKSVWKLSNGSEEVHDLPLSAYQSIAGILPLPKDPLPGTLFINNVQDDGSSLISIIPLNPTLDPKATFQFAWSSPLFQTIDGKLGVGQLVVWGTGEDFCNGPSDIVGILGVGEKDPIELKISQIEKGSIADPSQLSLKTALQSKDRVQIQIVDGVLKVAK